VVRTRRSTLDVVLRPRRQLTLPAEVCEELGIQVGDRLEIAVEEGGLVVKPRKAVALDALREIRQAFATSGPAEDELQAEGRAVRERLSRERYGEP
jgi:AbrB family looped-hinge helix DNA binding protein